jgi:cobyrinic acid a,c-diamide synthase
MERIMIAGTHSGVGKTTLTAGLIWALRQKGRHVLPFKVGPDYIDPGFHAAAAGVPAGNLDSWMMPPEQVLEAFISRSVTGGLAVIEGVMGLYDGRKGEGEAGSSAQVAKITQTPVLLVAGGAKMGRSAAALVDGFIRFDPDVSFAGVIFNHVSGESHFRLLQEEVTGHTGLPVLGYLPQEADVAIPERYLGLQAAVETAGLQPLLDKLAGLLERTVDLSAILAAAAKAPALPRPARTVIPAGTGCGPSCRIAVARDAAFHFYYQENLSLLSAYGAELVSFSPLSDSQLPAACDGVYLGGGFPELFAAQLAANTCMRRSLAGAAAGGMPVYAECGGYMYLARELTDLKGQVYPMAGVFPGRAVMRDRRRAMGYVEVAAAGAHSFLPAGETARGHEFHWSEMTGTSTAVPLFRKSPSGEPAGEVRQNCAGSYIHLHFFSNPRVAAGFVEACREFRQRRGA